MSQERQETARERNTRHELAAAESALDTAEERQRQLDGGGLAGTGSGGGGGDGDDGSGSGSGGGGGGNGSAKDLEEGRMSAAMGVVEKV